LKKIIIIIVIVFSCALVNGQIFEDISSDSDEFSLVWIQDSVIVFSSERSYNSSKWNFDHNCEYSSIWSATLKNKGSEDEHWTYPKRVHLQEQYLDLSIAGKSTNPNLVLLYNGGIGNGDLFLGEYKKGEINNLKRIKFPGSKESSEISGFWDEEKNHLYLCSNLEGEKSLGGFDIWRIYLNNKFDCLKTEHLSDKINSSGHEIWVSMKNDSLYFSSNGQPASNGFDIFVSSEKAFIWNVPERMDTSINSSFDETGFDPDGMMWCSNKNNNTYNIFKSQQIRQEIVPELIDTIVIEEEIIDTIVIKTPIITNDTIANIYDDIVDEINTVVDSLGFKMGYAYVQIGAYYYLHDETQFRLFYPNISDQIRKEDIIIGTKTLTKFMINIKYLNIDDAFEKQEQCFNEFYLPDPFVAVYNNEGERIVIFFKKDHYIVLKRQLKT
jgi:hypothetical protein